MSTILSIILLLFFIRVEKKMPYSWECSIESTINNPKHWKGYNNPIYCNEVYENIRFPYTDRGCLCLFWLGD